MNRISGTILLSAMLLISLSGCWEDPKLFPCENGSGVITSESRTIGSFTRLVVDIPADVYLHRDTAFSMDIEAQESLLEWISTDVTGNVLEIRNDRCFRSTKTIRIDLYLPTMDYIEVKGSGDVYGQDQFVTSSLALDIQGSGSIELDAIADDVSLNILGSGDAILDLTTESLASKVTGSGDLIAQGEATIHTIKLEGSGSLDAFDLMTTETSVTISGSGGAEVYADSSLGVRIMGSGNVAYKGTPLLDVSISGSGEVINGN